MQPPEPQQLQPLGHVRNRIRPPEPLPYNGIESYLELLPEFAGAAAGLEAGYIWVVTWLHELDGAGRLAATSPATGRRGYLGSRSPTRLNPVGLTCARILSIEGLHIHVDALDAYDGTPLLDLKPYVREFDTVFEPGDPAWRRQPNAALRLARNWRTVERFCGSTLTAAHLVGVRLASALDPTLDRAVTDPTLQWDCRAPAQTAAALLAIVGCALGSPRFQLTLITEAEPGSVAVSTPSGEQVTYRLEPNIPSDVAALAGTPDDALFRRL